MKRNMNKIIDSTKVTIMDRFDMSFDELIELIKTRTENIDLVFDSFVFGYAQGMKAEKAKMRKRGNK